MDQLEILLLYFIVEKKLMHCLCDILQILPIILYQNKYNLRNPNISEHIFYSKINQEFNVIILVLSSFKNGDFPI